MRKNYFELFGLEPNFLINTSEMANAMRQLLQAVHPDRFARATAQEQMLSMQQTTQINDAFAILKNPVSRAQYLLELKTGHDSSKEVTVKDPIFLMQQLELREELEAISHAADSNALIAFAAELERLETIQEAEIKELFAQDELSISSLETSIYKLQFLHKTLADIELVEDKMMA